MKILAINPGSTSTKIAVYDDLKESFVQNLKHSAEELAPFSNIFSQYEFRKNIIVEFLKSNGIQLSDLDIIVGRGGLLKPIPGGVYKVNDVMINELKTPTREHASNLGGIIANAIAKESGKDIPAYIVDPVVVDELDDIARFSGHPELPNISIFHALNQKAVARRYAREVGKKYEDMNLVVVHLGGGISIGAHRAGKVVDVNNALDGDGPFSPERTGTLPVAALADLCYSGKYTLPEMKKFITGKGGFVAYLGTNDAYEVEIAAEKGDQKAHDVFYAMGYQICKAIGSAAVVLDGQFDAIIITGGIARSKPLCEYMTKKIGFLGKVVIYPGEDEMQALSESVYYATKGEFPINEYK